MFYTPLDFRSNRKTTGVKCVRKIDRLTIENTNTCNQKKVLRVAAKKKAARLKERTKQQNQISITK